MLFFFVFSTIIPSYAQIANISLPAVSNSLLSPTIIKGLKVYPNNPLKFDFIVDSESRDIKDQSTKLIKYFLASLTTKESDMWVNLNPKQPDRIVEESFGTTEMGRDLLAQDYILKQITASLMHPKAEAGKKFWDKIYAQAQEQYGTTDIDTDILNRVWIVPSKATVYTNDNTAFVVEAKLKVLLEEEYLANSGKEALDKNLNVDLIKSIIVPELEHQVNEASAFAPLRQIYNSLILATWYKRNLKTSILSKVYVNQDKIKGLEAKDRNPKQIYNQYLKMFKDGAYNYIKEEYDPIIKQIIPKKYFSGGVEFDQALLTAYKEVDTVSDKAILSAKGSQNVTVELKPTDKAMVADRDSPRYVMQQRYKNYKVEDAFDGPAVKLKELKALELLPEEIEIHSSIPFFHTNESKFDEMLSELWGSTPFYENEIRVHIGTSGLQNLDIMASRKSQYGIIIDINPEVMELFKIISNIMKQNDTVNASIFTKKLSERIKDHYAQKKVGVLSVKVGNLLYNLENFMFGFVKYEKTFQHIRKMFIEDRIIAINQDYFNSDFFNKLNEWLNKNKPFADTLYVSN
ncbi:MAG: hypothetical protein P9X22_05115, partial [Candidatus Zapsychrus exili]|nr:hypothetical protein [Candidatus Zapsychrus exili]